MIYTNPLIGFFRTIFLLISGRVHFNKGDVGKTIVMSDGNEFKIFRRVVIKKFIGKDKKSRGLFIVRFTPIMGIKKNIKLSKILMLIFMGFKGFRSKYWCINEDTGMCQGVYEWDKLEDAEHYSKSIAVKNMTKRSKPGSISYSVFENIEKNRSWRIIDTEEKQRIQFKLKYSI